MTKLTLLILHIRLSIMEIIKPYGAYKYHINHIVGFKIKNA